MSDEQQAPASPEEVTGIASQPPGRKRLVLMQPNEGETPEEFTERYTAALYRAMTSNEHTTDVKERDNDDD